MNRILTYLLSGGVVLAAAMASSLVQAQQEGEAFQHTVTRGDTCHGLARRFLGDHRRCREILAANPGVPPEAMVSPGTTITIPGRVAATGADAELTRVVRRVEAQAPAAGDWQTAPRGLDLYRGWRVNTAESSAAEITFRDDSTLLMRSNTLVIIYGGEGNQVRRQTARARLDRGTLRGTIRQLREGSSGVEVETPSGAAALGAGSAVVSVNEAGESRLSNHEGSEATLRSGSGGSVRVRPGFGSKVLPMRRPTRPRPLPPAPAWADAAPQRVVGVEGVGGTIRGSWTQVPVARSYRVEVRNDEGVVAATEVPSTVTEFEVRGLAAGEYEVRLSTIDGDFFESIPSDEVQRSVVSVRLEDAGGNNILGDAEPDPTVEAPQLEVLLGAFVVSGEIECGIEGQEPNTLLPLVEPGEQSIVCALNGVPAGSFSVRVVAPIVSGETTASGGSPLSGIRGTEVRVLSINLPEGAYLRDSSGAVVAHFAPEADSGGMVATVRIPEDAPDDWELQVGVGEGDRAVQLASVTVSALAPDAPPPIEPPPVVAEEEPRFPEFEAVSLLASASSISTRPAPEETSGWLAVSRAGTDPGAFRSALGLNVALFDNMVHVNAALPFGLATDGGLTLSPGNLDPYVAVGVRLFHTDSLTLLLEPAAFIGTGSDPNGVDSVRLAPSAHLALRATSRVSLRTRQGLYADVGGGDTISWVSSYGVDIWFIGPLGLGIAADLAIGEDLRGSFVGFGIEGGLTLAFRPAILSLGVRAGLTEDFRAREGDVTFALSARIPFVE